MCETHYCWRDKISKEWEDFYHPCEEQSACTQGNVSNTRNSRKEQHENSDECFHWKWSLVVARCSCVSRRHRDDGEKALLAQHESKCTFSGGDELFGKRHIRQRTWWKNKNKFYTREYPMPSSGLHPIHSMHHLDRCSRTAQQGRMSHSRTTVSPFAKNFPYSEVHNLCWFVYRQAYWVTFSRLLSPHEAHREVTEQTRKPTWHVTGNAEESPICTSIQNYCQCTD